MAQRNDKWTLKGRRIIAFSIPGGILVASAVFPLGMIVRQALIGVMLIWFGVLAMGDPGAWPTF